MESTKQKILPKDRVLDDCRRAMCIAMMAVLAGAATAAAQLDNSCVVSTLNRTAQVPPDGAWVLPNVPASAGQVRIRATCVKDGLTRSGQSDFFLVPVSGVIRIPEIVFEDLTPIPVQLDLSAPATLLTSAGQQVQLTTLALYSDGTTADLTPAVTGTGYTSSNPAIATVSPAGVVTALVSGTVLVSAQNEGALGVLRLQVALSGDSDGDGLPDDFELANGLDPNNPVDILDDPDQDGLSTADEFAAGLNPFDPDSDDDRLLDGAEGTLGTNPSLADTDGDRISDGLEVLAGSNPLDPNSIALDPILEAVSVRPTAFTLIFNTALGEASRRLTVTGRLIDGSEIDLRSRSYGTNYSSSNLSVASFGTEDGVVFAGQEGTATITVTNGARSASTQVNVQTFSPTALAFLPLSGFPNGVAVSGDYAYVAAGNAGLHVVDVSNLDMPVRRGTADTPGNANDVRIAGDLAYIADGSNGLQIVAVSNPAAPAIVGQRDTPGTATDLVVRENFIYVADGSAGLQVIDATNPAAPVTIGSLDTPGNARGIDAVEDMVVIADAQGGVHVISVANPASPVLLGTAHTRPSSVSRAADVAVRGRLAYVADGSDAALGGLRMIDFRNPTTPVLVGSTSDQFGLVSVALDDRLALAADYFFTNAVPIFDVGATPVFTAVLDFSRAPSFRDDDGNGIAVRNGVVFLAAARGITDNGSSGDGGLHIGRAHLLGDELGVAPQVAITAPLAGASVPERNPITLKATATDDIMVGSVLFLVDGVVVAQDFKSPFEASYTVPAGVTSLTLGAIATDLGDNQGTAENVEITVVPDNRPVVVLLAPVAGAQIIEGTTTSIAADASDDVQVAKVEFFVNGALSRTLTSAPYRFDHSVPFGTTEISIVVVATDSSGQTASTEPLVLPVEENPNPNPCGEATCVPSEGRYISHFSGPGCTGTESYYLPYDGFRYLCRSWDGGGICGTIHRTVTNFSARIEGGPCQDLWPGGNTLSDFVTIYRGNSPMLSVSRTGTGSGTVTSSPAGINCGSACAASFTTGTVVTLTATAASGSTFAGWSGGGCLGTGSCTVTMSTSQTVSATFNGTSGGGCGEATCVPVQGMYISHFSGPGCTGTESYYLPYDGFQYSCRTWNGTGMCGTIRRTVTNFSARIQGGPCQDLWPTGNTLTDFVTVYR